MKEESLRQGSLWMISGQSVSLAAQALYFVLIGRALGSREYGAFIGVVALTAALSQFSSLGMEMILVRNVSRDRNSFAATWGQALAILLAGFVLLFAALTLFAHFALRPDLRPLVPWIALSDGLLGKLVQLASRAFQGAGRLAWTARLSALTNLCRTVTAGAVFAWAHAHHSHPTAYAWAKIYWLSTLAVALAASLLVTARLGWPRFRRIRARDLSECLSFSCAASSISVYNDIDKTFLVSLGQTAAAGIYSAAYRVVDAATMPIYSIYAAAAPRFFRAGEHSVAEAAAFARRTMTRTLPYAVLAAGALFLTAPLLPLAFGSTFRESVAALRWLCLLPIFRALHCAWGSAITASASQWNRTATQFAAAALNLTLNALLIPRWSWRGAAAASLLTDAALALFSWLVLAHLLRRESCSASPHLAPHRA
ncbi:MAG TPA: oligosaccharide flippase family protein [Acidobacteriaceae bacterium]